MIETEVKIRLNKEEFNKLSSELNLSEFHNQKNYLFNLEESFLRLRSENGRCFLTFKGQRQKDKFKSREEIEVEINSSEIKILKLLNKIGFSSPLFYEKTRASKQIGNGTICLDKLNDEYFLEVEGSEEDIEKNLLSFNMIHKTPEEKSYLEIIKSPKSSLSDQLE